MDIQVIVNQMIILFLVMIIGYIANKSGILDQTQNQKMSSLVLNITSPGLILSSVRAPTNGSLSSVIQIFLISIAIYDYIFKYRIYGISSNTIYIWR